jgi:hypothetical protein
MPELPPIGPYRGNPSLSPGYDDVKAIPYGITKGSILDRLSEMYANLAQQVFGEEKVRSSNSLVRNLSSPVSASSAAFQNIYGTVDDQLAAYGAFEANYRRAVAEEIRSGIGLSAGRRRALEGALRPTGTIDLNLISSLGERQRLLTDFGRNVLQTERMVRSLGFPALYLPSSNQFRATARMIASSEDGYQPIIDLLQQATFSIDPSAKEQSIETALRVGTSSLPPLQQLQLNVARGGRMKLKDLPLTARLFLVDTETTGVADIDIVRSLSVGTGKLKDTAGVRTIEMDAGVDLGARFDTAQMSGYVSADPYDLRRVTGLGTSVIEKETVFGSAPRGLTENIFDLKTEAGRTQAKGYYTDLLKKLNQDDAYFVAYNGQFDVNKLVASARSLGVADEIITKFEDRMANGGLIDVLGMVREKLNNKLAKKLAAVKGTPEEKAIIGLQSLLSDSALLQARVAGEAVKPFSLENILQSTNFLENLAQEAEGGSYRSKELLDLLSSSQSSHVDFTDRRVAEKVLEYTDSDKLDFLGEATFDLGKESMEAIAAARLNVASSRAIVATTNLADPRYLPQAVYENLLGTDAINNVEINTPISAIVSGGPDDMGILKFDPDTKSFRLISPNRVNPLDPIATDLPSGFDPRQFIRSQIDRMRDLPVGAIMPMGQPVIQTLGMSPINITNIHATNQMLMSGTSPLIDAVGTNIAANEEAFIRGLTATGQVGFLPLPETSGFSSDITRLMRGFHDSISDTVRAEYRQALYSAGISSASMDPDVRSTMVGMAQVTSPNMAKNTELLTRVATEPGLGEAQITGRVQALSSRLGSQGRYLRELGAVTAKTQKNIVVGDSTLLLPKKILEQASTLDDRGVTVGLLSQEAMASRGNAVRVSIARRASEDVNPTVNFIYGGRLVPGQKNIRKQIVEAKSLYTSTLAVLEETGRSPEAMIEAGLVTSKFEAERVLEKFVPLTEERRSWSI